MSVFDDPASLRGQSFGYALSPLDPVAEDSEEFVEATRLSVFVGEDGVVNISGPVKLYTSDDPIDCDEEPTFSKENLFIRGVYESIYRDVVPTTDGTLDLGSVSKTWKSVYAKEFVGDSIALSGTDNPISFSKESTFSEDNFFIKGVYESIFNMANPTFTGAPSAPTAGIGTNTTQLATTEFVFANAVGKAGDMMTGNLTIPSLNDGPLAGFRNLAINGNFDIWQRGTTNTGTVGVVGPFRVADRWASGVSLPSSNSPSGTFTVSQRNCTSTEFSYFNASFYQRLSTNNINVGTVSFNNLLSGASSILAIQGIENAYSVLGKTITLSFWARASASTKIVSEQQIHSITSPIWTPTICKTFDLTTTWQKFTHTYTIPTYSQVIAAGYDPSTVNTSLTNPTYTPIGEAATLPLVDWLFQIDIKTAWCLGEWRRHGNAYSGSRPSGFEGTEQTLAEMQSMNNSFIANGYYDIAQIQLELGPVATPFELRPYGQELALCQRYYFEISGNNGGGFGIKYTTGTTNVAFNSSFNFPTTMRVAPSVVWNDVILADCTINDLSTNKEGFVSRVSVVGAQGYRAYSGTLIFNAEL